MPYDFSVFGYLLQFIKPMNPLDGTCLINDSDDASFVYIFEITLWPVVKAVKCRVHITYIAFQQLSEIMS